MHTLRLNLSPEGRPPGAPSSTCVHTTHNHVLWPAGNNNNKFYRLQWLRQPGEDFVWTRWGRYAAVNCRLGSFVWQHYTRGQLVRWLSPGSIHEPAEMGLMLSNDQPLSILCSSVALACTTLNNLPDLLGCDHAKQLFIAKPSHAVGAAEWATRARASCWDPLLQRKLRRSSSPSSGGGPAAQAPLAHL